MYFDAEDDLPDSPLSDGSGHQLDIMAAMSASLQRLTRSRSVSKSRTGDRVCACEQRNCGLCSGSTAVTYQQLVFRLISTSV